MDIFLLFVFGVIGIGILIILLALFEEAWPLLILIIMGAVFVGVFFLGGSEYFFTQTNLTEHNETYNYPDEVNITEVIIPNITEDVGSKTTMEEGDILDTGILDI